MSSPNEALPPPDLDDRENSKDHLSGETDRTEGDWYVAT